MGNDRIATTKNNIGTRLKLSKDNPILIKIKPPPIYKVAEIGQIEGIINCEYIANEIQIIK